MEAHQNHDEILALEVEIKHHKKLLDQSFEEDACLEKTKTIFHDLKCLTEKLDKLKHATEYKRDTQKIPNRHS